MANLACLILLIFSHSTTVLCSKSSADPSKFLVWGPGLESQVVVPARYFYIQAVDFHGSNVTESLGDKPFTIQFRSSNTDRVRIYAQQLDRHDGSYIVRYKMWQTYKDLFIDIVLEDKVVAESPYAMPGDVYHDLCNCPNPSTKDWKTDMGCPASYRQMKLDLAPWDKVDNEKMVEDILGRFNKRHSQSLCHYVIKDNKIYRKTHGEHVGFKMFMDAILLSLTRKVKLPNIEFFVNLGDWPLEKRKLNESPVPIFSWCGSDDTRDIIMPTYDVTESTLETMGRVSLDLLSVQANTGPPWEEKANISFWRGRDSRQERLDLVRMADKHPDLIDAKLTNMFFFKKEKDLEIVKHISFFDFFKRKYQLNIDGTVAAYRLPYLLAADAVVLKQDSPYYEFFYKELQPYEHYIPIKRDLSDLLEKIKWAIDNDDKAKQIGRNAQEYVRNNLMSEDIFCYHVMLFERWAKMLTKEPKVLDDMELVEQPNDHNTKCTCNRSQKPGHDEF